MAVVIVNYNGWEDVSRLVETFARSPEVLNGSCDVVVVDNASDGPIPPEFEAQRPGVRLISRVENGGFAAGVNAGWQASHSPWILVLNPDVVPESDFLTQVLRRLERTSTEDQPGIVGFGLRNEDGTRQPSVGPFPSLIRTLWEPLIPRSRRKYQAGWRTRSGPVAWVTGACMLINARLLHDLGGMDEEFFLYYEEVALCRSARRLGWRVEFDSSIEVVHLQPLQARRISPKMRVITRHSKLLYFRKHLPRWQFQGLATVVAAESRLRGTWAHLRNRVEEVRAWRAISGLVPALTRGQGPTGTAVRVLAETATAPGRVDERHNRRPMAGLRRRNRRQILRKDGSE